MPQVHIFFILVTNKDIYINQNICCSSDRYTFKALTDGPFGCVQTGCEAKRTTSNSRPARLGTPRETFCQVDRSLARHTVRFARVDAKTFCERKGSFDAFFLKREREKKRCCGHFQMRVLIRNFFFNFYFGQARKI